MIEIFQTKNDFAPPIVGTMFERGNTIYNLMNFQEFETERKGAVYFGLETWRYRSL